MKYISRTILLSLLRYISVLTLLYVAFTYSFLFFHTAIETMAVVVSIGIFVLIWNARSIIHNNFLIYVAIIYAAVGVLNFFHLLSYQGMKIFENYSSTLGSQLWIAQRLVLSFSLPIAIVVKHKSIPILSTLFIYGSLTIFLLLSIFIWKIFPVTFTNASGITMFKFLSECVIVFAFLVTMYLLYKNRTKFEYQTYRLLIISVGFNIMAELIFTLNIDPLGIEKMLAHLIILLSYYFIYKAVIVTGLTKPYQLLFLEIQELSARKDELLSITSHELKNPLASINMYTHLITKELVNKKNSQLVKMLKSIDMQADKLNRLVSDLSDVGKIESGKIAFDRQNVQPQSLLKQIVTDFSPRFPNCSIKLKAEKGHKISCDRERIEQVIENLISNAINYSNGNCKVLVQLVYQRNEAIFSVKDHGIGITKEKLPYVFDKYFRTSDKQYKKGLGLGLYISREIIERHQGRIWAKSELGKGSTFYFSLPLKIR